MGIASLMNKYLRNELKYAFAVFMLSPLLISKIFPRKKTKTAEPPEIFFRQPGCLIEDPRLSVPASQQVWLYPNQYLFHN
jgi:hypothetical protein